MTPTPEQIKQIKENIDRAKAEAVNAINRIEVDEKGQINGTFALFTLFDGQPGQPMTLGFDKDLFAMLSEDFVKFLNVREKEEKINQIRDEKLRGRLLQNLQNSLK